MRYFITFACYGAHLHGDESGSVDRRHNLFGGRWLQADPQLARVERRSRNQPPYEMDSDSRAVVPQALAEVCSHRGWNLLAAPVRTNHAHVVIEAGSPAREGDGHVMEARDGCGRTRMFVKRSAMWSSGKASLWPFSWEMRLKPQTACLTLAAQLPAAARTDLA